MKILKRNKKIDFFTGSTGSKETQTFLGTSPLTLSTSLKREKTIKKSVSCEGIGVHSGKRVRMWIHPAPAGSGLRFRRIDIQDQDNLIPAQWQYVTETTLCTKLSNGAGVSISTIEHLMSALAACHIQNALIDVDGPEIPIMDGSALPFFHLIQSAGMGKQKSTQSYLKVLKTVTVGDDQRYASLSPAPSFSLSFEFDFQGRHAAPQQSFTFNPEIQSFLEDVAPARTFGFVEDVAHLRKAGLALGASLENSVGLSENQVLNEEGLRYADEFVRHKVLDALGDLYLAGAPLLGAYHGVKAGHSLNYQVVKALLSDPQAFTYVTVSADPRGENCLPCEGRGSAYFEGQSRAP
jgi:UDP-3-O-[3-hydroxymyristoyl] N-acetylglucosamine deacetylase